MIRIGRRKFIVPMYRDLLRTPEGEAPRDKHLREVKGKGQTRIGATQKASRSLGPIPLESRPICRSHVLERCSAKNLVRASE